MGTWGLGHWLVVLLIVVLVFGTKKLSSLGGDLGSALKNFKNAMREGEQGAPQKDKKDEPAKPEPPKAG